MNERDTVDGEIEESETRATSQSEKEDETIEPVKEEEKEITELHGPDLEGWGLPEWIADKVRHGWEQLQGKDRSKHDYFLACEMLRRGLTPEQIQEAAETHGWDFCKKARTRRGNEYAKQLIKGASASVARDTPELAGDDGRKLWEVRKFANDYRSSRPEEGVVKSSKLYREYLLWEKRKEDVSLGKFGSLMNLAGIKVKRRRDGNYRVLC